MNILCIGNSFSQDATKYLHSIAREDKKNLKVVNLYIGGCSLERHHRNLLSEERAYSLEVNGHSTGFFVSLREALLNRPWDVITLQQVSSLSYQYDSYEPYLQVLNQEILRLCPKAKRWIHQTWPYEDEGRILAERTDFSCSEQMLCALKPAYERAAHAIHADGILPSGELIFALAKANVGPLYRDGYHLSLDLGRYAAALLWYGMLTGASVEENTFFPWEGEASKEAVAQVRKLVAEFFQARRDNK